MRRTRPPGPPGAHGAGYPDRVDTDSLTLGAIAALELPESRWVDVRGPVHYREWDGPAGGPVFVLIHGLGGSHLNWARVAPALAARGRVLVPDLAGFGLTPLAGRNAGIGGNWRVLDGFLRALALPPVVLGGNSMGGMLALVQAAHAPSSVAGLILTNAAFPRPERALGVSTKLALGFILTESRWLGPRVIAARARRIGARGIVEETMKIVAADPDRIDPVVLAAQVEMLESRLNSREATLAHVQATHSLVWAHTFPRRYRALVRRVSTPAIVIHGVRDQLVPAAAARRAAAGHANWTVRVLAETGHVPQLERPTEWLEAVGSWLDGSAPVAA